VRLRLRGLEELRGQPSADQPTSPASRSANRATPRRALEHAPAGVASHDEGSRARNTVALRLGARTRGMAEAERSSQPVPPHRSVDRVLAARLFACPSIKGEDMAEERVSKCCGFQSGACPQGIVTSVGIASWYFPTPLSTDGSIKSRLPGPAFAIAKGTSAGDGFGLWTQSFRAGATRTQFSASGEISTWTSSVTRGVSYRT
jgi:hypothetical protein